MGKIPGYTAIIGRFLFLASLFPIFVPCVRSLASGFRLPLCADDVLPTSLLPPVETGGYNIGRRYAAKSLEAGIY